MNRVIFNILQEKTTINYNQLKPLENTNHLDIAFTSQHFPIYPLVIHLYLENPPFNKFSIVFAQNFIPQKASLHGSEDGLSYTKFHELHNLLDRQQQYSIIFKKNYIYNYIKILLQECPPKTKTNFCNQIKIKGVQFNLISFYNTRYVCSLSSKLTYHPVLFRLLEVLEYKYLLLKENNNRLYEKYQKRLEELTRSIENKKIDFKNPSLKLLEQWKDQTKYLESQPILFDNFIERPDPIKTKEAVNNLMKDIEYLAIDRVNNIKQEAREYFSKFTNGQIQQRYLKQISSSQLEDHNKALVSFWNDIKDHQVSRDYNQQQAILTFFNYYLQHQQEVLLNTTLKIMILFHKISNPELSDSLQPIYLSIFQNVVNFIHQNDSEQLYNLSIKYCYLLFDRINHQKFVQKLIKDYKNHDLEQQIQILGILQKLTFRNVRIEDKRGLMDFVINVLMNKEIQLNQKNRAYNILAYLACAFGKEEIMRDCQKLNSMILMTMEKVIDTKMGKILKEKIEQVNSCQYCGVSNPKFKDENLYDLHMAKQCKYITHCQFCGQNVEIPELFKHYIQQCDNKNQFKHCENCFEVINVKQEQKHNKLCERKLSTKCPLCYVKVDNKLKLKEHLILEGCPNNSR